MKNLIYPPKNSIDNFSINLYKENNEDDPRIDFIKVFEELTLRDYSFNTKDALYRDLKTFIVWYEKVNLEVIKLEKVTWKDIIDFKNDLKKEGMSVSTINRKLVSLRIFFNMAVELGYLVSNVCVKIKQFKNVWLSPKSLTQIEVRRLLKELELRWSLRDKVIIYLMLYSWLRIWEVVNLGVEDIFINERSWYIFIKNWKWWKSRKVPLSLNVREILSKYLEELNRNSWDMKGFERDIFRWQRWVLTEIWVSNIIKKYSIYSQVKLTPHSLRHTFAYSYLKSNNWDIVGLSQILWHSSIETTSIYTQNRLEDLQERVENI